MCLNLHPSSGIPWHLGLIRVWGSQSAETLMELVDLRLKDYRLVQIILK